MARKTGATQNEGIERAILGCLLEQPALAADVEHIQPEDFALSSHQEIFREMQVLIKSGGIIDLNVVAAGLEARTILESIGGIEYIAGLVDGAVHQNFSGYVRILKECSYRRQAVHALE